jgi:hypothetical protein
MTTKKASPSALRKALSAGLDFLLKARNEAGWWEDFQLAAGLSDEWVTGYIGAALARLTMLPEATSAAEGAWQLLKTRRANLGGWGFNKITPADADSTCWGLTLAHRLGYDETKRAEYAQAYLKQHRTVEGGITTYASEGPIRTFINAPRDQAMWGWCGTPHPCVSAAVANIRTFNAQLRPYVLASQQANGSWPAYWWQDSEYATGLAAEALSIFAEPALARAASWVKARTLMPQTPFKAAWQLRTLQVAHQFANVQQGLIEWLLAAQQSNGAWQPSAWLRVPQPHDKHPDSYREWILHGRVQGSITYDQVGAFTTATVLIALAQALPSKG